MLRHENARWLDNVNDVDGDAGRNMDIIISGFSAYVDGDDGSHDDAFCFTDVSQNKKQCGFLSYALLGYFVVWILAGIPFYILGITLADAAMQSEVLSKTVPLLSGITLVLAGLYQFSRLKMTNLLYCRSRLGCGVLTLQHNTGFQLGCKQGVSCCVCCSALMTVQLVFGLMNPLVMISVAIAIILEKLFPRPAITARILGTCIIIAGFDATLHWVNGLEYLKI